MADNNNNHHENFISWPRRGAQNEAAAFGAASKRRLIRRRRTWQVCAPAAARRQVIINAAEGNQISAVGNCVRRWVAARERRVWPVAGVYRRRAISGGRLNEAAAAAAAERGASLWRRARFECRGARTRRPASSPVRLVSAATRTDWPQITRAKLSHLRAAEQTKIRRFQLAAKQVGGV